MYVAKWKLFTITINCLKYKISCVLSIFKTLASLLIDGMEDVKSRIIQQREFDLIGIIYHSIKSMWQQPSERK